MSNISTALQEIWEVEDRLYEETKDMDLATYIQFVRKRVKNFLQNKGYKIEFTKKGNIEFLEKVMSK